MQCLMYGEAEFDRLSDGRCRKAAIEVLRVNLGSARQRHPESVILGVQKSAALLIYSHSLGYFWVPTAHFFVTLGRSC
eukprot:2448994-Amphidinium_carterae.1